MEHFVCIHGHFYQPPRENPWLEAIEIQDSAYPYHDWNERITAECYAPNTASRKLDNAGRIQSIVSNYARISFNFGPTLLSWMESYAPDTYQAILEADRQSMLWRSGHGAALAQIYNHLIMPLATRRDKETQVLWGVRDFEHRFKRLPEGIWLAETAVDTETLEVVAAAGISFTILAPHQAQQFRRIGEADWQDVSGARIDPSRAYFCKLPSGNSINLFFYDGPISQAVAFEKLLGSGEQFASRLMSGFAPYRSHAQLCHIATDGESYGHHSRFGEMALGHALNLIEEGDWARLTNYGEYLALHPPEYEVQIVENSSWSCLHGIERWRNDCGCNSGGNVGWNQQWRRPLREALDDLSDRLAVCYGNVAGRYLKDPWAARNDYIDIILDRSEENLAAFLGRHARLSLDDDGTVAVLSMMELQRHVMLMYTSCGWFFDELSGLETIQILQYAARAIQLAERYCEAGIETPFMDELRCAESNIQGFGNGADVYRNFVKPAMINLIRVGAHYAVSSIFEDYGDETEVFSYRVWREDCLQLQSAQLRLSVGRIVVRSSVTRRSDRISFCTLYFGGHALNCGVRSFAGEDAYTAMKEDVTTAFNSADFAHIIRLMDVHFGMHTYSLKDLFLDEQRLILKLILAGSLQEFEETFSALYENNRSLMGFVRETGMPLPHRFLSTAETALNLALQRLFAAESLDTKSLQEIVGEVRTWNVALDSVALEFVVRRRVEHAMACLLDNPPDEQVTAELIVLLESLRLLTLEVNLWLTQNRFWEVVQLLKTECVQLQSPQLEMFFRLGELLYFVPFNELYPAEEEL